MSHRRSTSTSGRLPLLVGLGLLGACLTAPPPLVTTNRVAEPTAPAASSSAGTAAIALPPGQAPSKAAPARAKGETGSAAGAAAPAARGTADTSSTAGPATASARAALPEPLPQLAKAAKPAEPGRLWAIGRFVKIRQRPNWRSPIIGLLRAGQSVALRSSQPADDIDVEACAGGWYAIEPRGFVCLLADHATLAPDHPRALAARELLPDTSGAFPFRYGSSLGSPRYYRIPTREEQLRREWQLEQHLAKLPPLPSPPNGPSPALARYFSSSEHLTHHQSAYRGMKISWVSEFFAEGRVWVVTPDLLLLPRDKVEPHPHVAQFGHELGPTTYQLPFAMVLGPTPKLRQQSQQAFVEAEQLAQRQLLPLSGRLIRSGAERLYETAGGFFVRSADVSAFLSLPRPEGIDPDEKWVRVNVNSGSLVAYEGDRPVYAATISPGVDGTAKDGQFKTPTGRFRVASKYLTSDMGGSSPMGSWRSRDVPWVAYFDGSYALHGAWWHDRFGRPRSHGCVNLTPQDARWLFHWLEPKLPEGWYAVSSDYGEHRGTRVVIRP